MRSRPLARALVCTTLLLGTTSVAYAEPSAADVAQARDLGQQALAAYDTNDFAAAEKLFVSAQGLFPAPTLTLGLARTQVKLGKLVAAQESYNKIIREQGQATNLSPAFKDALEAARTEVGPVSAKIASVVLRVDGAPSPTVTLDGQPIAAAALGLKRPVDPGAHVVRAEAQGFKPAEQSFQVAEAGSAEATLTMTMEKADVVAPTAQPNEAAPAAQTKAKSSRKTLAIVALGVGGAGLVLGGVTGAIALGKHGDLDSQCPDGKCPDEVKGDVDGYKAMGMLSTVGFIVGAVGVGAGAVLWFTAPKEQPAAARGGDFTWHPYLTAGGGGVTGSF
jgi:hypothetical protein